MSSNVTHQKATHVVAHHFDNAQQQREATRMGMWVFLVTEIMFFGGMFTSYVVYRWRYPEAFIAGSHHLDVVLGTVNTAVLLISSYTVAMSLAAIQRNRRKAAMGLLVGTISLAMIFLAIKGYEYWHKYQDGLIPGWFSILPGETGEGEGQSGMEVFLALYFVMTGVHAAHMVIGVGIFLWLLYQIKRDKVSAEHDAPVEIAGLYWHFVDIVWVFLFPMLYLVA